MAAIAPLRPLSGLSLDVLPRSSPQGAMRMPQSVQTTQWQTGLQQDASPWQRTRTCPRAVKAPASLEPDEEAWPNSAVETLSDFSPPVCRT